MKSEVSNELLRKTLATSMRKNIVKYERELNLTDNQKSWLTSLCSFIVNNSERKILFSSQDLARFWEVSTSTVRYRLHSLIDSGAEIVIPWTGLNANWFVPINFPQK